MNEERCTVQVADAGGYTFHRCARKAKEDGLCSQHLAARRRRDRYDAERKRLEVEYSRWKSTAESLEVDLGVAIAVPYFDPHYHSSNVVNGGGYAIVKVEDLEKLRR